MATLLATRGGFQLCDKRTTYVQVSGVMSQVQVVRCEIGAACVFYCCDAHGSLFVYMYVDLFCVAPSTISGSGYQCRKVCLRCSAAAFLDHSDRVAEGYFLSST